MVICLERGADLHTAQLMPLPLTVSCFSEIQIGFTFLVVTHPGVVPDNGPLNVYDRRLYGVTLTPVESGVYDDVCTSVWGSGKV